MKRILKKTILWILTAFLVLLAVACKGNEARKVDELIRSIGTVTTESKEAIDSAESAYNELSDEEKSRVTEYELLQKAINEYEECLLDALEADSDLSQLKTVVSMAMNNYSPKFTLNREEKVLYMETTADKDSTDIILYYPGLSTAVFNALKNNMCDISSQIYEITQQYEVDSVIILKGIYDGITLLEIKNGEVTESVM